MAQRVVGTWEHLVREDGPLHGLAQRFKHNIPPWDLDESMEAAYRAFQDMALESGNLPIEVADERFLPVGWKVFDECFRKYRHDIAFRDELIEFVVRGDGRVPRLAKSFARSIPNREHFDLTSEFVKTKVDRCLDSYKTDFTDKSPTLDRYLGICAYRFFTSEWRRENHRGELFEQNRHAISETSDSKRNWDPLEGAVSNECREMLDAFFEVIRARETQAGKKNIEQMIMAYRLRKEYELTFQAIASTLHQALGWAHSAVNKVQDLIDTKYCEERETLRDCQYLK